MKANVVILVSLTGTIASSSVLAEEPQNMQECYEKLSESPVVTLYEPLIADSDDFIVVDYWCKTSMWKYVEHAWRTYHFKSDTFDGFGFDDPCNLELPTARVLNAHMQIKEVDPITGSYGGDWDRLTTWDIRATRFKCEERANASVSPVFIGGDVSYFMPFAYWEQSVSTRSGTIAHEGAHASGALHSPFNMCPRGASCDGEYGDGGAVSRDIDWMWYLRDNGEIIAAKSTICGVKYDEITADIRSLLRRAFHPPSTIVVAPVLCYPLSVPTAEITPLPWF